MFKLLLSPPALFGGDWKYRRYCQLLGTELGYELTRVPFYLPCQEEELGSTLDYGDPVGEETARDLVTAIVPTVDPVKLQRVVIGSLHVSEPGP